jgi:hypothetical protein
MENLSLGDALALTRNSGSNGEGSGFFNGNGDWAWIIILFLLFGWGRNGFGGGFGGGNDGSCNYGGFGAPNIYGKLDGITYGISDATFALNNNISNGFTNVQSALCQGFNGVNQAITTNGYETRLATQGLSSQLANCCCDIQRQIADCCCENRAGLADLKYTVATEACSDRQAVTNALFDVTTANNANTQQLMNTINNGIQAIQDKLCQQEIEALKTQNQNLQTQLNMANLAASQGNQTATIQAGQRALANEIEQYVLPTPRPAYVVQNPNCCAQNNFGCGCGCGMA